MTPEQVKPDQLSNVLLAASATHAAPLARAMPRAIKGKLAADAVAGERSQTERQGALRSHRTIAATTATATSTATMTRSGVT